MPQLIPILVAALADYVAARRDHETIPNDLLALAAGQGCLDETFKLNVGLNGFYEHLVLIHEALDLLVKRFNQSLAPILTGLLSQVLPLNYVNVLNFVSLKLDAQTLHFIALCIKFVCPESYSPPGLFKLFRALRQGLFLEKELLLSSLSKLFVVIYLVFQIRDLLFQFASLNSTIFDLEFQFFLGVE